jgi:hypothetical protein
MQTLRIEVSYSIYEHIIFFLQSLPKNLINISHETKPTIYQKKSLKSEIEELFTQNSNLQPFQKIKDPVEWQKSIRDEWE